MQDFFTNRCVEKEKNFANAREVRNLFEYAISRQASRVILVSNPTQDNLTLLKRSDVFGEDVDLGKQQYMAQKVMSDLTKEKRHGVEMEYMDVHMDEFEIPASAEELLYKNQISTVDSLIIWMAARL